MSYSAAAIGSGESLLAGTSASRDVIRAADLLVHGMTVTAEGLAPSAGELAVFCRPVVTAPAFVVRLGELEAHLGDGVIEELVDEALAAGRLRRPERRRIMSYPLVIRLMIAMTLMPGSSYCESVSDISCAGFSGIRFRMIIRSFSTALSEVVLPGLSWAVSGPGLW